MNILLPDIGIHPDLSVMEDTEILHVDLRLPLFEEQVNDFTAWHLVIAE